MDVEQVLWSSRNSQGLSSFARVWWTLPGMWGNGWWRGAGSLNTTSGSESAPLLSKSTLFPAQVVQWMLWLVHGELFPPFPLGLQFNVSFGEWGVDGSYHLFIYIHGWVRWFSTLVNWLTSFWGHSILGWRFRYLEVSPICQTWPGGKAFNQPTWLKVFLRTVVLMSTGWPGLGRVLGAELFAPYISLLIEDCQICKAGKYGP